MLTRKTLMANSFMHRPGGLFNFLFIFLECWAPAAGGGIQ